MYFRNVFLDRGIPVFVYRSLPVSSHKFAREKVLGKQGKVKALKDISDHIFSFTNFCKHFTVLVRNDNYIPDIALDDYIEDWQRAQIKPIEFYEREAKRNRHYFYTIDLQGRLFLEESRIKNIATSLKDFRFLNFFFKQLRVNNTGRYRSI